MVSAAGASPVYIDTSALAELYVAEAESRLLEMSAARVHGGFDLPAA